MKNNADAANIVPVSGHTSALNETSERNTEDTFPIHVHSQELHSQYAPQRILVVEDDSTLANLEVGVLTAHGYNVVSVHNGELAVATLGTFVPDLVVLDLELSGQLNGWDVLQQLRSRTTIPVLFTTSSETTVRQHIRSRRETRLTLDHLPKPYPMQTFLKRVQRMLTIASQ